MNSIHNNGKDNKSLDQDLEELDLRYQSVRSDEPPELLDQAILNRAHRATEAKNSWLDFGWIHGLTTVALAVLTFSVVVSLRDSAEFDPTTAPFSDKPLRSQNRQQASETTEELKAKKDVDTDADAGQFFSEEASTLPKIPSTAPAKDSVNPQTIGEPDTSDIDYWEGPAEAGLTEEDQAKEKRAEQQRETEQRDTVGKLDFAQQTELLDIIMKLKLAGNKDWKERLDAFIKTYPDYPLPDELKP